MRVPAPLTIAGVASDRTPEGIKKRGEAEAALWGSLIRELKIEAD